ENWDAAIFAQAGLERINLRPVNSVVLDWMLPAPAQGAIVIVSREDDAFSFEACQLLNHESTARCTKIERDFLRTLLGGCSTPISALAVEENDIIHFKGNILSLNGREKLEIEREAKSILSAELGNQAAREILEMGGQEITNTIRNAAE
ncbi:MAG TPA: hydroxymethylbilane synthase, partial [Chitinophagaceae bacterium]|nr:hydroxymethylbilane synthase [Chitinophagaceae bacterium]